MSFYKLDNEEILEAPNGVYTPTNTMTKDNYQEFSYPVEGWYWFDTIEEAYSFFGKELMVN